MKAKTTKPKTTKVTIRDADPQLAALLNEFAYRSYEVRYRSNANDSLYIRLTREMPAVHLKIA